MGYKLLSSEDDVLSKEESELRHIAEKHGIDYCSPKTPFNRRAIITRMSRDIALPISQLYSWMADVGNHGRFFPHLRAMNVLHPADLANVIGSNQVVVVEGLAEGGSKLGIKLFSLFPEERIEGELLTDPFVSAVAPGIKSDRKDGSITWAFKANSGSSTKMTIESDFEVPSGSPYIRGTIDHVWLDFFENVMVATSELKKEEKLCSPFPQLVN